MKKTVYVGMVGDMLHAGHINIIKTAKQLGKVVVGVLTDGAVVEYKRLPFLDFEERVNVVKNIMGVSEVVPQNTLSYSENLRKYRPDYVVHGDDWKYGDQVSRTRSETIEVLAEWGGELVEVPYTKGISSTLLHKQNEKEGIISRSRQGRLRRLLSAKKTIRVIEAHSALSAKLVSNAKCEKRGITFDALWQSSLTDSAMRGKPDSEVVGKEARVRTIDEIFDCTSMPLIYDGDTGGTVDHLFELTKTLDKIGVSALCIEDKVGAKRNSLYGINVKQQQATIDEFVEKITAFKNARKNSELMLVSRIESFILNQGLKDALQRACSYVEAGTDAILIHSISNEPDEVFQFSKEFRKEWSNIPIFVVPTKYWNTTVSQFSDNEINAVIYANQILRSIIKPIKIVSERILTMDLCHEVELSNSLASTSEILKDIPEYI